MIQSRAGVSLVGALIGSGLLVAGALGVGSVLVDLMKSTNQQKVAAEVNNFTEELRSHLSSTQACINTFQGQNPFTDGKTGSLTSIYNSESAAPTVRYAVDQAEAKGTFKPSAMTYTYRDLPTPGTGELVFSVASNTDLQVQGSQSLKAREIIVSVQKDPATNNLLTCISKARMTDGIWRRVPSSMDDIFYTGGPTGGKVGIGIPAPDYHLHVGGSGANGGVIAASNSSAPAGNIAQLFVESGDIGVLNFGHNGGAFGGRLDLRVENVPRLTILQTGQIGIGTTTPREGFEVGGFGFHNGGYLGIFFNTYYDGLAHFAGYAGGSRYGGALEFDPDLGNFHFNISTTSGPNGAIYTKNYVFGIRQDGDVVIKGGGGVAATQSLNVGGNIYVHGSGQRCTIGQGGGLNCTSDERLKAQVRPIPDALSKIRSLRGVEFTWNILAPAPGHRDIGVIAQEVEKVFPSSVITDSTGYKALNYSGLVAPLIEAVKELADESQKFRAELKELREQNTLLKESLCRHDSASPLCEPRRD